MASVLEDARNPSASPDLLLRLAEDADEWGWRRIP